jgi:hypothetical protein
MTQITMIVMPMTVDNMKNPPTFEIYFSSGKPGTHKKKHTPGILGVPNWPIQNP